MQIQQQGWRRSVRWFLAEFVVVVSGILVALAAQAWYGASKDARLERGYVRQLISDLDGTVQTLQQSVSQDSLRAHANLRFVEAWAGDTDLVYTESRRNIPAVSHRMAGHPG